MLEVDKKIVYAILPLRGEIMSDAEARYFIEQMSNSYKNRKLHDNLYTKDDYIPENIITTYYTYVKKPAFSILIEEYKEKYIYNEARIERNINPCEQVGLGIIYNYIQEFDFEKDYFNIFVTSMLLHQKLYCKCVGSEFGGSLRDTEVILHDLHLEIMPARQAKEYFNSFITKSDEIFLPLQNDDIFSYINNCIKVTTIY